MMGELKKQFDNFVFDTRVKPAITASIPLILIAIHNGWVNNDWSKAGIGFFIIIVLISFAAYIVRETGKSYEEKMYKKLGGMPTTIIIRFSDSIIDNVSKIRYHKWLNEKVKDIQLPLTIEEEETDEYSDEKYTNAMRFLRIYANSNREKLPRVYQDLKKYNYWRNLYGCKWMMLIVYLIIVIREVVMIDSFSIKEMFKNPFYQYIVLLGMLIWIALYCLIVTKKTVERNAFDYAKTLLETIDYLNIIEE